VETFFDATLRDDHPYLSLHISDTCWSHPEENLFCGAPLPLSGSRFERCAPGARSVSGRLSCPLYWQSREGVPLPSARYFYVLVVPVVLEKNSPQSRRQHAFPYGPWASFSTYGGSPKAMNTLCLTFVLSNVFRHRPLGTRRIFKCWVSFFPRGMGAPALNSDFFCECSLPQVFLYVGSDCNDTVSSSKEPIVVPPLWVSCFVLPVGICFRLQKLDVSPEEDVCRLAILPLQRLLIY